MESDTTKSDASGTSNNENSLLDLVGTLWRRKMLVICITAVSVVGVLAYSIGSLLLPPEKSYLPNIFTPKAVMIISDQNSGSLSAALASSGMGNLASLAGISTGITSNGQLAILIAKSNTSLDELNEEFDFTARYKVTKSVKADTRMAALAHLSISFDEKTSTLSISFSDIDPLFAQRVVNRLVEILDRRFTSLGGNKALKQKELLETKIADVVVQTKKIEGDIKVFTARYGVVDVEALAVEQVTVMARLRSELIMKDLEIENYQKFSKIEDPVIQRLKNERESLQAKLTELDRGPGGGILPTQQQLPALAFEYGALQRDLAVQTEIYKFLTQQYELAKMNAEGQDPVFQVLELAETPDKKSGPRRGMICILVSIAGFFLATGIALVLNAIEKTRNDPEAMKRLRGAG